MVEHNADEIYSNACECISQAMHEADLKACDVASIGITNQNETTIVLDKKRQKALHNAIV